MWFAPGEVEQQRRGVSCYLPLTWAPGQPPVVRAYNDHVVTRMPNDATQRPSLLDYAAANVTIQPGIADWTLWQSDHAAVKYFVPVIMADGMHLQDHQGATLQIGTLFRLHLLSPPPPLATPRAHCTWTARVAVHMRVALPDSKDVWDRLRLLMVKLTIH